MPENSDNESYTKIPEDLDGFVDRIKNDRTQFNGLIQFCTFKEGQEEFTSDSALAQSLDSVNFLQEKLKQKRFDELKDFARNCLDLLNQDIKKNNEITELFNKLAFEHKGLEKVVQANTQTNNSKKKVLAAVCLERTYDACTNLFEQFKGGDLAQDDDAESIYHDCQSELSEEEFFDARESFLEDFDAVVTLQSSSAITGQLGILDRLFDKINQNSSHDAWSVEKTDSAIIVSSSTQQPVSTHTVGSSQSLFAQPIPQTAELTQRKLVITANEEKNGFKNAFYGFDDLSSIPLSDIFAAECELLRGEQQQQQDVTAIIDLDCSEPNQVASLKIILEQLKQLTPAVTIHLRNTAGTTCEELQPLFKQHNKESNFTNAEQLLESLQSKYKKRH